LAEGDTILRTARRLERALRGKVVKTATPNPRGRAAGVRRLDGRVVQAVRPKGKHLIFELEDLVLHSHLGMNGSWRVYRHGEAWGKPTVAAWAVLQADTYDAVQFGGPTLRVLPARSIGIDPVLARLGPDVLAPGYDPAATVARMRADPGRELGEALLDQGLVAGIGNIFKSEACFAIRADPWGALGERADEEIEGALLAARDLMLAAAERGRHPHRVYKRSGRPCPRCGTPIRSRGQGDANRTTYWCPNCQSG
jgi:endonuclease VIII